MKLSFRKFYLIFLPFLFGCKYEQFLSERITFVSDSVNIPYKYRVIDERYMFDKFGRTIEHTYYNSHLPEESTHFIYYSDKPKPDIVIDNLTHDTIKNESYDYRTINIKLIANYDSINCKLNSNTVCDFKNGWLQTKRRISHDKDRVMRQIVYYYKYNYRKK